MTYYFSYFRCCRPDPPGGAVGPAGVLYRRGGRDMGQRLRHPREKQAATQHRGLQRHANNTREGS